MDHIWLKEMYLKKIYGFAILGLFVAGAAVSHAQPAVMQVRGCGTSCRVETKQLSKPTRMGGGWAKVLIREDWIVNSALDGIDHRLDDESSQYWFFANCFQGLVAFGARSDRKDAEVTSIYTADGNKKDVSASHNLYERYQILCEAVDLK